MAARTWRSWRRCAATTRSSRPWPLSSGKTSNGGATGSPRGTGVLLDLYGTNHDGGYWPAPERFDPERFLGEEPDRFAFVPQGGGDPSVHHRCPGEPSATRLMGVALDQMVRHMTYTPLTPSAPIDFGRLPALPAGGYPIRLAAANSAT